MLVRGKIAKSFRKVQPDLDLGSLGVRIGKLENEEVPIAAFSKPFRDIGGHATGCSPHLIGQRILLFGRKTPCLKEDLDGQSIGKLKDS